MNIIEKYAPINTKERIDAVVEELKNIPGAMNPTVRAELYEGIKKSKLQMYFQEKYPIDVFPDYPCSLNKIAGVQTSDVSPVKNKNVVAQSQNSVLDIPLPPKTKGSNKYIYGTYLEMAFHNFFQNMQHIYKMVFGGDIMKEAEEQFKEDHPKNPDNDYQEKFNDDFGNEDYVWNPMFERLEKANPEELLKAQELIHRHFPLIAPAEEAVKEANKEINKEVDSIEILKRLSQTLRILRNLYSHYYSAPRPGQKETYKDNEEFVKKLLEVAFIGAKREVKKRFAFDNETMENINPYEENQDDNLKDEKGEKLRVKIKDNFHYKLTEKYNNDNKEHLSLFGLVFLTSLFLEKKYSKILADKARCILPQDQNVMTELIAVYRIRLHQEKFYVTKNTDALAFDILTEMRRCPKELFELLPPEEQRKFRVASKDDGNDDVLMMRHSDRFPHLVMKYIDDSKLFEDIRFQVSLGKYFYKFYDKRCIDDSSMTRVRALSKNVNGFGRITETDDSRMAVWDDKIREYAENHSNTSNEKPYVTDHHPRYIINGNRIAMHIFDEKPKSYIPELRDDGATNLVPSCWMSIYELPAMAFLILLRGGAYTEDIIKSTVTNYRKLFADVAEGRLLPMADELTLQEKLAAEYNGVSIADIPQDMKDYLTGKSVDAKDKFHQSAFELIESLIEQTNYKLKKFEEQRKKSEGKDNKIGKKGYVKILPGKLAAFLAKDMMFFQPNDDANRNKLTSLNFRILQSVLALYDGDRDKLDRTLTSAHIIGNQDDKMCNPIVMSLWNKKNHPSDIKDFYAKYLEERLNYLKSCRTKVSETLPFLHADRMRWQEHDADFYRAKASRYLSEKSNGSEYKKAIELPRGLFEKYIREELMAEDKMRALATDESKNISYLIYGYFRNVENDDYPSVYESKRTYPLFNLLYRLLPQDPAVYLTAQEIRQRLMRNKAGAFVKKMEEYVAGKPKIEQKAEKEHVTQLLRKVKDNETTLKRYKIQDIILFMIAKKILSDEQDKIRNSVLDNIHLKDIQDKDALSQKIKVSVTVEWRKDCKKELYQDDVVLKHYGQFYRVLNDRRMPSLLHLVIDNKIEKTKIDEELDNYDKEHPHVLENVFDYERDYARTHDSSAFKGTFKEMVEADDDFNTEDKKKLVGIRNAFAHQAYIRKFYIEDGQRYYIGEEAEKQDLPEKAKIISETFKAKIKKR